MESPFHPKQWHTSVLSDVDKMDSNLTAPDAMPWTALRRFTQRRSAAERCELCSEELAEEHQHLVQPSARRLVCACDACAILFDHQAAGDYRRVPRRVRFLEDFRLTDLEWNSLGLPIGLAFFLKSTPAGRTIAVYPSPGGPTESQLELDAWDDLVKANPVLAGMEPDTEALLVNRTRNTREYYLAPLDQCYRLVGILRSHWRGLSGGTEVWQQLDRFFAELKQRCR